MTLVPNLSNAGDLYDSIADAAAGPATALLSGPPQASTGAHTSTRVVDTLLWSLQRTARNAVGPTVQREALERLYDSPRWRLAAQVSFVAWADLIEGLVQAAEQQGPADRSGATKAREVSAVVAALKVSPGSTRLPPDLVGIARDGALGWTIDGIVLMLDHYSLWRPVAPTAAAEPAGARTATRFLRRLARAVARLARAVAALGERAAAPLEAIAGPAIGPSLADHVGRRDTAEWSDRELEAFADSMRWFARHRRELVGTLELVFNAVQMAFETGGEEDRQRLAKALVLATLEDLGLDAALGPLFDAGEFLVECVVAASVRVFEKREAAPARPTLDEGDTARDTVVLEDSAG